MSRIFADNDVIIDFLTRREPFFEEIKDIFQLCMDGKITINISSVTVVNVNYILCKEESRAKAFSQIEKLVSIVQVLDVGETTIKKALSSNFKVFEDAVQNACAMESKIDILITRNVKDYRKSRLSIMTPKEYLVKMELI